MYKNENYFFKFDISNIYKTVAKYFPIGSSNYKHRNRNFFRVSGLHDGNNYTSISESTGQAIPFNAIVLDLFVQKFKETQGLRRCVGGKCGILENQNIMLKKEKKSRIIRKL